MTDLNLPTYTVPDDVYASFFYRATGTAVVEKGPLPTTPKQYPPVSDYPVIPVVYPTPMAIDPVAKPSPTGFLDTPLLYDDPPPVFGDVSRIQVIEIQMPTEVKDYPAFTTSLPPSYTTATQNTNDTPISPIAIIGLATGGAISVVVALAVTIIMCTRRRRTGRYRQNSITSQERPIEITAPTCKIEPYASNEQVHELPSSFKSSSSGSRAGSNRSRRSKHITWKDQVFSDQSFMTLPPLPPHPASISLPMLPRDRLHIGEDETREPGSSGFVLYLPDDRIPYRYFSSPTLGADRTSIYSSMPSSPMCVSTLSPIPSYLFPAPHSRLQRSQVPTPQYHSIMSSSSELNDYYATITCTSIHSFLPGGRRSLSDSFVIQEAIPPSPTRKSLTRNSGNMQTFHPSFSYPKSPVPLPKPGSCTSPIVVGRTHGSAFLVTECIENDGASISSVSSTGSSILNYRIRGTPRKLLTDGLLRAKGSSPHSSAFDDSPPSGGLTSPSHRPRHSELPLPTVTGYILDNSVGPRTSGPEIGIALSPRLFSGTFVASSSSSERIFQDVFLDTQDTSTQSPTLEEISTRHFSCSMPTRSRIVNGGSSPPPYPQVIPPSPTQAHVFPDFCGRDSPTLPRECIDLAAEGQVLGYDSLEINTPKLPRRMRGRIESSYSPTLSMVNFYTMGNRADSRFSSVNFFTPFSSHPFPTPYHARSSSVPSPMSPMMNYWSQSQDEDWKRESLIKEYPPDWSEERFRSLSFSLDSSERIRTIDVSGIDDNMGKKGKSYGSPFFLPAGGYLTVDERVGENEDDEEWGGAGLGEIGSRRAESID